jgi:hypothetical protein
MALTTGGSVNPDGAAKSSGTRMDRMEGVADVAESYTPPGGSDNASDTFIGGSTLGTAKTSGGVKNVGGVPGTPGFPGDTDWPRGAA